MRALPSGVEILDHVLGGITPGLPCVLAGPSGTGRTVLALQLAAAALESGRVVAFLCNEPAPFLLQQAASLGIDLRPALQSGQLALLEMDPEISTGVTALGTQALIEAIAAEQPLCSLLIVDPATVLMTGIFDEAQLRSSARDLVRAAGSWSVVLTVESERLALQHGLEKILGEVCGSFSTLSRDERGVRRLHVEKTRSGMGKAETVEFVVDDAGAHIAEPEPERGDGSAREPADAPPEVPAPPVTEPAAEEAPVASPTAETEPATRKARDPGDLPRVLVVDDDPASRHQLEKWLCPHYEVQTAHDGFEAMTCVLATRPDLVILDLVIRRVTGYELLAAFQRALDDVPRLVLSSRFERPADRLSPLVLGATDLLAKPLERFELLHKVDLLLALASRPQQIMDPHEAQALFATPGKTRVMDAEHFHERLERACRFGERFDIPSSLVVVRGASSPAIEELIAVADARLRFEDAVLRVSARRAVVLLVATPVDLATQVLERLLAELPGGERRARQCRYQILPARSVERGFAWQTLFQDLGELPGPPSSSDPDGEATHDESAEGAS